MAYLEQKQAGSRKLTAALAVGGIHVIIGYALITGLSMEIPQIIKRSLDATTFTIDPPPPPKDPIPPQASQETPAAKPMTAPDSTIILKPLPSLPSLERFDPAVVSDTIVPVTPGPGPIAQPSAKPSMDAQAAAPSNSPSSWATSNDYPSRALREGLEGVSSFRVIIGTDGKVRSCEITDSSGHALLDQATCNNISRRARFKPAKDESGTKIMGSYSSSIRWKIPN